MYAAADSDNHANAAADREADRTAGQDSHCTEDSAPNDSSKYTQGDRTHNIAAVHRFHFVEVKLDIMKAAQKSGQSNFDQLGNELPPKAV